jgi:hypothetical protein
VMRYVRTSSRANPLGSEPHRTAGRHSA